MTPESSNANGGPSLAAVLEAKHAQDAAHKVSVEDTLDEEDIQHPPPSSLVTDAKPKVPAPAAATPTPAPAPAPVPKSTTKARPAFDVQSEELFPALGSGPKPKTPAAATWGAKPSSVAAAAANGAGVNTGMFPPPQFQSPG